jgi:flagellar biosynthetic protein FliR
MHIATVELFELLQSWLWPFLRIGGLVMAAPIIGSRSTPARVRIILTLALSFVIIPVVPSPPAIPVVSPGGLLVTIQQIFIGVTIGLAVRMVFMALEFAGQLTGMQMALGFAAMIDPQTGTQVPVVSQFYIVFATLLFLTLNGHLILIEILVDSFQTLPVGVEGITQADIWQVINWASWLFSSALLIALPALISLLIINFAFGVMTKAAPQLNIFAVGFPLMLMVGMFVILVTFSTIDGHFARLLNETLSLARALVGT